MSKSNVERQRDFRQRRKERREVDLFNKRTLEEKTILATWNRSVPVDEEGKELPRPEISREWCLDQLRLLALDPARATPGSVAAIKVLLQELPKGATPMSAADRPIEVSNTVQYKKPAAVIHEPDEPLSPKEAAIKAMWLERAIAKGQVSLAPVENNKNEIQEHLVDTDEDNKSEESKEEI